MEITKEQVLDLYNVVNDYYVDEKLKEWFPDAFKVELKVGKVFKGEGNIMVYITDVRSNNEVAGYGFMKDGKWSKNKKEYPWGFNAEITEATTEEWESALIAEAKKRGLYDAQYFKHANILTVNNGNPGFVESIDENKIWTKYGCIYHKGVWAEIIKTFSKEEAEQLLGGKII
jgi:hypothetical protein